MAPEILIKGHISKAADVYAFGMVLWELYTAQKVFKGIPRALLGHQITQLHRWGGGNARGVRCGAPDHTHRGGGDARGGCTRPQIWVVLRVSADGIDRAADNRWSMVGASDGSKGFQGHPMFAAGPSYHTAAQGGSGAGESEERNRRYR
jgi:hypothetical protein